MKEVGIEVVKCLKVIILALYRQIVYVIIALKGKR